LSVLRLHFTTQTSSLCAHALDLCICLHMTSCAGAHFSRHENSRAMTHSMNTMEARTNKRRPLRRMREQVTSIRRRCVTGIDLIQLTYADVCWRMLTYAGMCWRVQVGDGLRVDPAKMAEESGNLSQSSRALLGSQLRQSELPQALLPQAFLQGRPS
jgi:hypothetical protein